MKSAYELAMERLSGGEPEIKLTDEHRAALAEVDAKCRARLAEKEVFLGDLIAKALAAGNPAEVAELEEQRRREMQRLREQMDREKDRIRESARD